MDDSGVGRDQPLGERPQSAPPCCRQSHERPNAAKQGPRAALVTSRRALAAQESHAQPERRQRRVPIAMRDRVVRRIDRGNMLKVCLYCAYVHKLLGYMLSTYPLNIGRDDWIRTSDPLTPSQVRYQTAPHPADL